MNISSRQLKAFVLTARHQSFSRAAEQLFITQSGMSVLVRELEGQLGFRLFDRTTRKVALTEFGTKFLPIADRSLLELEAAAAVIGRAASVADRRIAIGATPLIASKLLPSVISDYAAHSPGMKIVLHDGDRSRVVAMALSGEIDVGLRSEEHTSELQSRPHLVCRLLLEKKKDDRSGTAQAHTLPRDQGSARLWHT